MSFPSDPKEFEASCLQRRATGLALLAGAALVILAISLVVLESLKALVAWLS